ncbi:hypothetical protein BDB01DRAFT_839617 [Pilobolus umbonatus]|nr:hypothetical protein BDB01DRAFT_839617 [Pilobolus umbonatus]
MGECNTIGLSGFSFLRFMSCFHILLGITVNITVANDIYCVIEKEQRNLDNYALTMTSQMLTVLSTVFESSSGHEDLRNSYDEFQEPITLLDRRIKPIQIEQVCCKHNSYTNERIISKLQALVAYNARVFCAAMCLNYYYLNQVKNNEVLVWGIDPGVTDIHIVVDYMLQYQ